MLNTIYKITNKLNGKVYIGKTQFTIEERWIEHVRDSSRKRYEKRPLYDAFNKYGIENFKIEEIETNIPDELINEKEQFYINQYRSYIGFEDCNGYNATLGGDGKKYKEYIVEDVIKKFQECKKIKETAENFNLDPSFVKRLLIANNVELLTREEIIQRYKKEYGHPVYQIDLEKDIILNSFNSISEASVFMGKKPHNGTIHDACKARRGHHRAYGYRWYFQEEWEY